MVMKMDCIFCKIANKEMDANILYEDDLVMVIMDAFPDVDGHSLIIPKKHYTDFTEIPDELILHINKIAQKYSKILMTKLNKESLTLLVNYGDDQKVKHYHLHLLPNFISKDSKHAKEEIYNILKG